MIQPPIDFSMSMVATPRGLMMEQDLEEWETEFEHSGEQCHLYFVVSRPQVWIVPSDTEYGHSFQVELLGEKGVQTAECRLEGLDIPEGTRMSCKRPYTEIEIVLNDGTTQSQHVADLAIGVFPELRDLKVEYIGQTFGSDGYRPVRERILKGHSRIQRIYADAARHRPHLSIWLMPATVDANYFTIFVPRKDAAALTEDLTERAAHHLVGNPVPHREQVNLSEAALIKHFQPAYNKHFRDSFPSKAHTSYRTVYELGHSAFIAEVALEHSPLRLFSDCAPPTNRTMATFRLVAEDGRFQLDKPETWHTP